MKRLFLGFALSCSILALAVGCQQKQRSIAPAEAPTVPVSLPVREMVIDSVDFTGRTDAVQAVDIRPRVTGYLTKMPFQEGREVKKGTLLFEVDPRPYQAQLDQAEGQVKLTLASLNLAKTTYARDRAINARVAGGVSAQQLDQDRAAVEEAEARVQAYKASLEVYKLNLDFCRVKAPIDGRISRYYLTVGNLVNQDQTLLTTVVSLDPMYAYFDMDEPTLLRIRRAVDEGKIKRPTAGTIPVYMGLQGEETQANPFPHEGRVNFVNNQVNPTTGSISFRGVFANPPRGQGIRLLSPGMFVRIRFPIGDKHPALLVVDRSISSDQGLKFVYVIVKGDKVRSRRIETGALQSNGLRVIAPAQFKATLDSLDALKKDGVPPDVISKVEKLKGLNALPESAFVGNLAKVLSPEELKQMQTSWVKLTPSSLAGLRSAGVSKAVLAKLEKLKDQDALPEDAFVQALAKVLSADELKQCQAEVMNRALKTKWLYDLIATGLMPDELVVVGGLLQIRPRMTVQWDKQAMPKLTQAESDKPLPPGDKK